MRENEELNANLLSVTNDRDRFRSQLQEAGVEVTDEAGGKAPDGGNIIEEKVTCTAFTFELVATLMCRIAMPEILFAFRTKRFARFAKEWRSCS